jgi:hypothetical protein
MGPSRHSSRLTSSCHRQHQHRGPFYGVGGFGALLKVVLGVGVRVLSWLSAGATRPVVVGQALSPSQRLWHLLRPLSLRSIFPHRAEVLTSTPNMQIKTITAATHHCVVRALARCRCLPQRRPRPSVLAGVCSVSYCRHSYVTLRSHVPLCTFCYHVPLRTLLTLQLFRCRVFHVALPSTM